MITIVFQRPWGFRESVEVNTDIKHAKDYIEEAVRAVFGQNAGIFIRADVKKHVQLSLFDEKEFAYHDVHQD